MARLYLLCSGPHALISKKTAIENGLSVIGLLPVKALTMKPTVDPTLVAPCGMNCALCAGYLSYKNSLRTKGVRMINCVGCRPRNKKCAFLKGKCSRLSKGLVTFCHECPNFPCERLRTIDDRYKSRYRMSMIANLNFIKNNGLERFVGEQEKTWKCRNCDELISCHNGLCFKCDLERLKNKKQMYRWDEL